MTSNVLLKDTSFMKGWWKMKQRLFISCIMAFIAITHFIIKSGKSKIKSLKTCHGRDKPHMAVTDPGIEENVSGFPVTAVTVPFTAMTAL
jgi:hypothetical protein